MNHLKASLESVWVHSNQNWEVLLKTLENEIGVQVIFFFTRFFFNVDVYIFKLNLINHMMITLTLHVLLLRY